MKRVFKKNLNKKFRKRRVRAKISGTASSPRLSIFRSNKYLSAQLINDEKGETIISGTTTRLEKNNKTKKAHELGKILAEKAKKAGIKHIVFDRGSYKYHGRIKTMAESFLENLK